ncbi:hypothetical protein H5410_004446 [Solanum commersonii]|uniref:Uncharacterized protein n=1 Tax=Solanum commersonii TaxID=4109 RepID=A0A9J6B7T5_SOLCO|nr:hypothetical protein H5410_004446 [Solanum commersonii]
MHDEWRWNAMVPLYKTRVISSCNNYGGIKLLSHTMKIWERVVEMRVRRGCPFTRIGLDSCGAVGGRSHSSYRGGRKI